jgi:hypothetical protein
VLIATITKRLQLEAGLYKILRILNVTAFEKTPLDQLLEKRRQKMIGASILTD